MGVGCRFHECSRRPRAPHRTTHRRPRHVLKVVALLAAAWALGGCAQRGNEADEAARAALTIDDATPRRHGATEPSPRPAVTHDAATARMDAAPVGQWFAQEGPVAAWGVPNSESVLSFACDAARGEIIVMRDAVGVPAQIGVIALDADGLRRDLPARREVTALGPRLVARIALHDPLLDRLRTASTLRVQAGADTLATSAPGVALERVLGACHAARRPTRVPAR